MFMQIEESELQEILNKKKKASETKHFPIEALLSLVGFFISALMAQIFTQVFWLKILFWFFVLANIVYIIFLFRNFFKAKYTDEDFINEIKRASDVRKFSLLVLQDISGLHKDKYLLRYDKRWKCYLLPYRNTHVENDKDYILEYVTSTLGLNNAKLQGVEEDDIIKFSISDQITKSYHHTFYNIVFDASKTLSVGSKSSFILNEEKYKWFSIDEMKRNKSISKKNSETVNYIASHF